MNLIKHENTYFNMDRVYEFDIEKVGRWSDDEKKKSEWIVTFTRGGEDVYNPQFNFKSKSAAEDFVAFITKGYKIMEYKG